jgi:hypothetical protein
MEPISRSPSLTPSQLKTIKFNQDQCEGSKRAIVRDDGEKITLLVPPGANEMRRGEGVEQADQLMSKKFDASFEGKAVQEKYEFFPTMEDARQRLESEKKSNGYGEEDEGDDDSFLYAKHSDFETEAIRNDSDFENPYQIHSHTRLVPGDENGQLPVLITRKTQGTNLLEDGGVHA